MYVEGGVQAAGGSSRGIDLGGWGSLGAGRVVGLALPFRGRQR